MITRVTANPVRPLAPRLGTVSYDAWKAGDDEAPCPLGGCSCCGPRTLTTYRDRVHAEHGGTGASAQCRECDARLAAEGGGQ